jgi:predicted dehydrogenase
MASDTEHQAASPPRVAIVGCGVWGRNHVRNHAELGSLAAVVDHHADVTASLAATYGVPALSFDDVLADASIDAVVFALPPSQNVPLGMRALAAGKHLFVEKPMALGVADADTLCRQADRLDRRLMSGHILQYHPAFGALRDLVRDRALGPLLSMTSTRLDLGRIRREEDALWALAPHDVSMILALAGAEPDTVSASGGFHTHPAIADAASVSLGFADGLRAEIRVSWLHPVKEQRLVVVGRDAMAVFDDREPWESKLVLYRHRLTERGGRIHADRAEPEPVTVPQSEPLPKRVPALPRLHSRRRAAAERRLGGAARPQGPGPGGRKAGPDAARSRPGLDPRPALDPSGRVN